MGSTGCPPAAEEYSQGDLLIVIRENLESACFESEPCIYRAPEILRKRNEDAYTPRVVSIGPFHHGRPRYEAMEKTKWNYLKSFIQRRTPNLSIEKCLQAAERWEELARRCYAETIGLSRAEFIKMLMLDSIFLVEFFLLSDRPDMWVPNDPIYGRRWMWNDVRRDIYLLENQLPLFVIKDLFEIVFEREKRDWVKFLGDAIDLHDYSEKAAEVLESPQPDPIKHILDGVIRCLLSSIRRTQDPADSKLSPCMPDWIKHTPDRLLSIRRTPGPADPKLSQDIPTATAMSEAGVKFKHKGDKGGGNKASEFLKGVWKKASGFLKVRRKKTAASEFPKSEASKLLDIQYANGVLQIPRIIINDSTESNFRNLILWEQCHYLHDVCCFTDYVCLMDDLINTTEDVDLLVREEIVANWLGESRAVANLFNNTCKDVIIDKRKTYDHVRKDLIAHCSRRWNRWRATLMRDYFGNPWRTISVIAGVTLLLLTILQTIFSGLSL